MNKKNKKRPGRPAKKVWHFDASGRQLAAYPSCAAAARALGMSAAAVLLAAKRGSLAKAGLFSFTRCPPRLSPKSGRKRPVLHGDRRYESTAALARALGTTQNVVYYAARKGRLLLGEKVTFVTADASHLR